MTSTMTITKAQQAVLDLVGDAGTATFGSKTDAEAGTVNTKAAQALVEAGLLVEDEGTVSAPPRPKGICRNCGRGLTRGRTICRHETACLKRQAKAQAETEAPAEVEPEAPAPSEEDEAQVA